VSFDVVALDLTDQRLLEALGLAADELRSADRTTCQTLADIAVDAGFDAVLGPSAAAPGETTLAVFGSAIRSKSRDVQDHGVKAPKELDAS
jgi:hypothetical protein